MVVPKCGFLYSSSWRKLKVKIAVNAYPREEYPMMDAAEVGSSDAAEDAFMLVPVASASPEDAFVLVPLSVVPPVVVVAGLVVPFVTFVVVENVEAAFMLKRLPSLSRRSSMWASTTLRSSSVLVLVNPSVIGRMASSQKTSDWGSNSYVWKKAKLVTPFQGS